MNNILLISIITALLSLAAYGANAEAPHDVWSKERAIEWEQKHGWLVGCNFSPAYAINELEMWQPDTFDLKAIDHELGLAESLGFNSIRVFLQDLLWQSDPDGFLHRMDQFLEVAHTHHIGVMFVIFDSCWDPFPATGKQREPKPHVHNSGWMQCPGQKILMDPARHDSLKDYVMGVIHHFRHDRRIDCWDLFNEPDNSNGSSYGKLELPEKPQRALQLIKKAWSWAREVNPDQPLTAGVWYGDWDDATKLNEMQKFCLENSDVISFHDYGKPEELSAKIAQLKPLGRPILCTEYMARPQGSTFNPNLKVMKDAHVAAYNWGFVSGKTQTIYPWDSWDKQYTAEPPVWFHDIFRTNGEPYIKAEVDFIRQVTGGPR